MEPKRIFLLFTSLIGLYFAVLTDVKGLNNLGLVILWGFALLLFFSLFFDIKDFITESGSKTKFRATSLVWVFCGVFLVYFDHIFLGCVFLLTTLLNYPRTIKELNNNVPKNKI